MSDRRVSAPPTLCPTVACIHPSIHPEEVLVETSRTLKTHSLPAFGVVENLVEEEVYRCMLVLVVM